MKGNFGFRISDLESPLNPEVEEVRMNLYEAKTPLLRQGGEFRLILCSSFAANCPAGSGSLNSRNSRLNNLW